MTLFDINYLGRQLFEVYALGGGGASTAEKDKQYLHDKTHLTLIACVCCISGKLLHLYPRQLVYNVTLLLRAAEYQVSHMKELLLDAFRPLLQWAGSGSGGGGGSGWRLTRPQFAAALSTAEAEPLISQWCRLAWDVLPSELRLESLSEIEGDYIAVQESRLENHKSERARHHHKRYVYRHVFQGWLRCCKNTNTFSEHMRLVLSR